MRELMGFAAGLVAGAAGAIAATSESGRRLRERLVTEAEPDVRAALDEWDPLLREVARAVKLGVTELEATATRVREYVERLAEEEASSMSSPDAEPPSSSDEEPRDTSGSATSPISDAGQG